MREMRQKLSFSFISVVLKVVRNEQMCLRTTAPAPLRSAPLRAFALSSCQCDNYDPAIFGSGTRLTVLEPGLSVTGPTVTLLPPSSRECRNQKDQKRKKTIVCVASGFYPDHVSVSWEVNGQKVTDGVATDGAALRPEGKFYRISSRLRVSAEDWFRPDSVFTCIISFFNGTSTEPYSASLWGEAAAATEVMSRETYLRITQAAKLSYGVFILKSVVYGAFVIFLAWKLQGWTGKQNL